MGLDKNDKNTSCPERLLDQTYPQTYLQMNAWMPMGAVQKTTYHQSGLSPVLVRWRVGLALYLAPPYCQGAGPNHPDRLEMNVRSANTQYYIHNVATMVHVAYTILLRYLANTDLFLVQTFWLRLYSHKILCLHLRHLFCLNFLFLPTSMGSW